MATAQDDTSEINGGWGGKNGEGEKVYREGGPVVNGNHGKVNEARANHKKNGKMRRKDKLGIIVLLGMGLIGHGAVREWLTTYEVINYARDHPQESAWEVYDQFQWEKLLIMGELVVGMSIVGVITGIRTGYQIGRGEKR
jgi:hypothetical protein